MEFIPRPDNAPQDSKGASADTGKYLQAVALAGQLGKTVEEVLAFMGTSAPSQTAVPKPPQPLPISLKDKQVPVPVDDDTVTADAAIVSAKEVVEDDKFIITEVVELEDASETDLNRLAQEEEEEENDWTGKIRVGSKVKIVYQVNASRINWVGKKGKVIRIVGNEAAKVFEVEFAGGKVPKIRLNKKTGKLEKGYEKKVIRNTFSEDQVEICD